MTGKSRLKKSVCTALSIMLAAASLVVVTPKKTYAEEIAQPSLYITKIMYDPPGNDNGAEYVEISNVGQQPVDISGFYIGDAATPNGNEGMYQFPAGTVIDAGESLVVAQSAIITRDRYGFTADFELPQHNTYNPRLDPSVPLMLDAPDWGRGYLVLAQGGDDILLMDAKRQVIDYVPYIIERSLNGVLYDAAPAMVQHIQTLQRVYTSGDASVDFWPMEPTPGEYYFREDTPHPFSGQAISDTLLITEVLYDAIHDEDTGEYIEFTNISGEVIDISGYHIGDSEFPRVGAAGEGMFRFPEGTLIEPYQVMVVAGSAEGLYARYGVLPDFEFEHSMEEVPTLEKNMEWTQGTVRLANAGDQALLYDADMQIIDAVVWMENAPFPGASPFLPTIFNNNGHSIERLNATDTNNVAADFVARPDPSPGIILFGPNADVSRIPDHELSDNVLMPREPESGIIIAPTVIANGGDAIHAPENTLSAIEELLELDASQVLLPVQQTADGELVLMKDDTLNRTTNGNGRVDQTPWSVIQTLDAGSWFAPGFAGERVPLLEEALDLIEGSLIPVIQVNTSSAADKVVRLLEEKDVSDAHIISEDTQVIAEVRTANSSLRGGLWLGNHPVNKNQLENIVLAARSSGAQVVVLNHTRLTKEVVHYLRVRGISVWAVGGESDVETHKLIAIGADGILTEDPQLVSESLQVYPENTIIRRHLIGGHRGSMDQVPENTLLAAEEAWQSGVDLIEVDILETKDGHLILMHDDNVDRTTDGTGKVRDKTLAEIKQLNANYVNPAERVEVPTLEEFLLWVKDKNQTRAIAVFLEIKAPNIEQKIIDLVQAHNLEPHSYVISFRLQEPVNVRQLNQEIGLVYIHNGPPEVNNPAGHAEKFLREAVEQNVHFNPSNSMTPEMMHYSKHRGLVTFAWPFSRVTDFPLSFADEPVSLEAPERLQARIGQPQTMKATVTYRSGASEEVEAKIRVLESSSHLASVNAEGTELSGIAQGKAWIQLYYEYEFNEETYILFTPPAEVMVRR
ncbi:glycerophosphodiester phosphodiesterase family protein [Paenibacillus senegalensis]|uniref:glycerophosphodiester phosphodiesterase family protein n=1 Tax=Paenibacillus senegalensis TaxID=1465766 RepID=UPI000288D5B4|nr:glycerophosphodiester phosphodiesterase family protein [Paenibacillus senegalensis]